MCICSTQYSVWNSVNGICVQYSVWNSVNCICVQLVLERIDWTVEIYSDGWNIYMGYIDTRYTKMNYKSSVDISFKFISECINIETLLNVI